LYDCIVVGGGLVGMLTARRLTLEGQSVLLLDQGQLGSESSWAGGGILSPLYPWRYPQAVSELAAYSHQHYPELAQMLEQESGIDPEWTQTGLLILDGEEAEVLQARQWSQQFGWEMQSLNEVNEIRALEPRLSCPLSQALWMPEVAQLRNPRLVKALKGSLQYHGVAISEQESVQSIEQKKGRVVAVKTDKRTLPAESVVVTAGAWSSALLNQVGINVDVKPVRGQMLVFKAIPGLIHHTILHQGHYLIPRRDGRILMGSTLEYVGFDKSTTTQAREELIKRAQSWVPELAQYEVEKHWSGLRPGSPTGVPYIGSSPELDGLYFNCGHFRNGVILGLASVDLLVDQMLGHEPVIDPLPYAINAIS